jgi:hypothetical protein
MFPSWLCVILFRPLHSTSSWIMLILLYRCRHFNGEESFDTGPMAPSTEPPVIADSSISEGGRTGTKL